MDSTLLVDGKKLSDLSSASAETGFSVDYIERLIAEESVVGMKVGRRWFVDIVSLKHYQDLTEQGRSLQERRIKRDTIEQRRVADLLAAKEERRQAHRKGMRLKARAGVVAVLMLGLAFGTALQNVTEFTSPYSRQVASAPLVQQVSDQTVDNAKEVPGKPANTEEQVLNFSHESVRLATLEGAENGILLLPTASSSTTSDPTKLFSDEVKIMTDETGTQYVVRIDASGNIVEKIPFVIVPVKSEGAQ